MRFFSELNLNPITIIDDAYRYGMSEACDGLIGYAAIFITSLVSDYVSTFLASSSFIATGVGFFIGGAIIAIPLSIMKAQALTLLATFPVLNQLLDFTIAITSAAIGAAIIGTPIIPMLACAMIAPTYRMCRELTNYISNLQADQTAHTDNIIHVTAN